MDEEKTRLQEARRNRIFDVSSEDAESPGNLRSSSKTPPCLAKEGMLGETCSCAHLPTHRETDATIISKSSELEGTPHQTHLDHVKESDEYFRSPSSRGQRMGQAQELAGLGLKGRIGSTGETWRKSCSFLCPSWIFAHLKYSKHAKHLHTCKERAVPRGGNVKDDKGSAVQAVAARLLDDFKISWTGRRSQRCGISVHVSAYVGSSQIAASTVERMLTHMNTTSTVSDPIVGGVFPLERNLFGHLWQDCFRKNGRSIFLKRKLRRANIFWAALREKQKMIITFFERF